MRDAHFAYGERQALDGLNLDVSAGEVFGLLGPNGSGKSTLLAVLIGRRQLDSGTLNILGESPSPSLRRHIGVVFQEPSLDSLMSVRETMRLHGRIFGMASTEADAAATRLLEQMGLQDRANAATATLSGGLKRRLELARALLPAPELLLLDEPTLALDPDSRLALWEYLTEANRAGCTLVVATNDVQEADRYCHRVALISEGVVVAVGTPDELKGDLRHEAVRLDLREDAAQLAADVRAWDGIGGVRLDERAIHVTVDDAPRFVSRAFEAFGQQISGVRIDAATLEDVYFQLVGRGIGDVTERDNA